MRIYEIGRLHRTLIHLAQKIQSAQNNLRSYIGVITTGQENERMRLARELHDQTIQDLIALNQVVQMISLTVDENNKTAQIVLLKIPHRGYSPNVRRITRDLRPFIPGRSGAGDCPGNAGERDTECIQDFYSVFHKNGTERRLASEHEIALFRIAQEGLNNTLQHAKAKNIFISLVTLPHYHNLLVSDNGCGFEVPESPGSFAQNGHFGLLGIHERAELIGARLEICSSPEKGTQLIITLPLSFSTMLAEQRQD